MKEFYGFIYLTICLINGKMYVGKKKYSGSWKTYLGSGKHFKNALKKYGKENFIRLILENCKTKKELSDTEKEYIYMLNAVNDNMFYNLAEGGEGGNVSCLCELRERKVIVNNNMIFDSINDAANFIGVNSSWVSYACYKYHKCKEYEVWFLDDIENYKSQEYYEDVKKNNYINAKSEKIIIMPERIVFDTCYDCLKYTGGTLSGLKSALNKKNGCNYRGHEIVYEKNIELYLTKEERDKIRNDKLKINNDNTRKRLNKKCIIEDLNLIFESTYDAANFLGCHKGSVSTAINRNQKLYGHTIKYI